jgi:hypothetical protein
MSTGTEAPNPTPTNILKIKNIYTFTENAVANPKTDVTNVAVINTKRLPNRSPKIPPKLAPTKNQQFLLINLIPNIIPKNTALPNNPAITGVKCHNFVS